MRHAVDPAQSRYDAGNQCWEVHTDAVHRGHAPARTADHQDPWQPRCNGVRRRHTLAAAEAQREYLVCRDRGDLLLLEGEARGYGVPCSGRGLACSSAGERGRRHTDDDEASTARQGR